VKNRFSKLLLMGGIGVRIRVWAIRFYEKYGFRLVGPQEKDRLLKKYRSIPERQIETSVVLVEARSGDKLSS